MLAPVGHRYEIHSIDNQDVSSGRGHAKAIDKGKLIKSRSKSLHHEAYEHAIRNFVLLLALCMVKNMEQHCSLQLHVLAEACTDDEFLFGLDEACIEFEQKWQWSRILEGFI